MRNYGPDNNEFLIPNMCVYLNPTNAGTFTFESEAKWEQAICVYNMSGEKIAEKGTYTPRRNLEPWNVPDSDETYVITGWHKEVEHGKDYPWIQSVPRTIINGNTTIIGFEDKTDGDFNDITMTFNPLE